MEQNNKLELPKEIIKEYFNIKRKGNTLYNNKSIVYHQPLSIPEDNIDEHLKELPKIAAVMLTKDNYSILEQSISTLFDQKVALTLYLGDTGSSEFNKVQEIVNKYNKDHLNIILLNIGEYNYSKNHNFIFNKYIKDNFDLMFLINNDIKFIDKNQTLKRLLLFYMLNSSDLSDSIKDQYKNNNRKKVGVIGSQLLFPYTRKVQHSGMLLNYDPFTLEYKLGHDAYNSFIYDYNIKEVFGSTFALALTSTDLYAKIGGLNEDYISMFQDVEYNVKAISLGYTNYVVGSAIAYHYESSTRIGYENIDATIKEKNRKIEKENMILDYSILNPFLATNSSFISKYNIYELQKPKLAFILNNLLHKFNISNAKPIDQHFPEINSYFNYSRTIMVGSIQSIKSTLGV